MRSRRRAAEVFDQESLVGTAAADVDVEFTIDGDEVAVAEGVDDGCGSSDEAGVLRVGEVLEVLDRLVELASL